MDFLNDLTLNHWAWFIIAVVLLGLEMMAPGVVFLWIAIAAGVIGGIVFVMPDLTWEVQFIMFAVLSIISVFMGRTFIKRNPIETEDVTLNHRGHQYVGNSYILLDDMDNGKGKVRIGDSNWAVEGEFDGKKDEKVRVTGVDVTVLKVEKA